MNILWMVQMIFLFKCTWFLGETILILGGVKIVACSVKPRWFEQKLLDGGIFYPIVFQMHTWSGERSFGSDFWMVRNEQWLVDPGSLLYVGDEILPDI